MYGRVLRQHGKLLPRAIGEGRVLLPRAIGGGWVLLPKAIGGGRVLLPKAMGPYRDNDSGFPINICYSLMFIHFIHLHKDKYIYIYMYFPYCTINLLTEAISELIIILRQIIFFVLFTALRRARISSQTRAMDAEVWREWDHISSHS